jgi:hypothetical protein
VKLHYISHLIEILNFALLKQKVKGELSLSKINNTKNPPEPS